MSELGGSCKISSQSVNETYRINFNRFYTPCQLSDDLYLLTFIPHLMKFCCLLWTMLSGPLKLNFNNQFEKGETILILTTKDYWAIIWVVNLKRTSRWCVIDILERFITRTKHVWEQQLHCSVPTTFFPPKISPYARQMSKKFANMMTKQK